MIWKHIYLHRLNQPKRLTKLCKYTDGGFENIDDLYEIMTKYYTNKLESQTRFSQEKIVSFHHNFRKLETSILNDNRLVIQKWKI